MATTTATLTLSSSDLTGDTLSLSTTATLTAAGSNTGLSETTGVSRKTFASATGGTLYVLVDDTDYTNPIAAKVYIKNLSTTAAEYVSISVDNGSAPLSIGRLYAGDWTLLSWDGVNSIAIDTSHDNMTVEYMVIYETV